MYFVMTQIAGAVGSGCQFSKRGKQGMEEEEAGLASRW